MYPISNVLGLSIIIFNKISIGIKVYKLNKVICSTQYKYIKDFDNLDVLTY